MNANNVLSLLQTAHIDQRREHNPNQAERAGQAIISMLQQAADVAKRNEERAKAQAQGLQQELAAAEARIRELEGEMRHLQERAVEAEEWLLRVFQEAKTRLIEPLVGRAA